MHNPTDQDVMDLYSTPSNTTASSLMDAYLNPEFQYSLQLATLNHYSNNDSITATTTATTNSATTTTVPPPTSSFDLFWELSSPSFENNVPQMLQQQQQQQQGHSKPSLPLLPDKSESESLSNSVTLARASHQEMDSNVSKRACSTPLLKYHRSVSQLHQAASSQRPSPTLPIFNHRASLPNIYPVNGDGGYANQHSSSPDTFTSTPSGNSHRNYNSHYLTAAPTTWDQGLQGNRHHPRSASTFDESTRKRTKSMDNMNDKQPKGLAQQYYQTKQLYLQQNHPQFHLQHGKQQQYLYPTQQYQPNSVSSTINIFSIDGSAPALEYPNDSANVAFYPSSCHPQHHNTSPSIKSPPVSPFSSLSTISSTNTTKNHNDEMLEKDDMHHFGDDTDISKHESNEAGTMVSPLFGSGDYISLVPPTTLVASDPSSTCSSSSPTPPVDYAYGADHDTDSHSATPRRQNPRYDADVYTPRWVRYTGQQKQGYCESCQPLGKWLQLKNSAYWYHKQFFHGISSVSGQPFTSPLEQRINKETDLLEGLCHQCLQFVPICNTKRKNSVLWYRHAHKCHIYDKPKSKSAQQP